MLGILPRDGEPSLAPLVSELQFKILIWVQLSVSIVAFFIRISIRTICLRRLLVEDYLMVFTLFGYVTTAVIYHVYLGDIYIFYRVSKGLEAPGPDFPSQMTAAVRAQGIIIILTLVGIWTIKLNYLFFFRRLTRQMRVYIILWRVVLGIFLVSGAVNLALIPYQCMFGNYIYILEACATDSTIMTADIVNRTGVGLDVATDCILVAFPIMILWPTKLRLTQKILLSCFFSLTLVVVGVTLVRGSIFGAQFYKSMSQITVKFMDFIWMLFWYWVEFSVAFIIASLVSFRSLFTNREQKHRDERYERYVQGAPHQTTAEASEKARRQYQSVEISRGKLDNFYDSVLETVRDWEGAESDMECGNYRPVWITKTVDLSQRTSQIVRKPETGLKTSQPILATYCYYDGTRETTQTSILVKDDDTESYDHSSSEDTDLRRIAKPELAHIATAF
ncbi:unnamed protein product [Discula destructiva]